MWKGGLHYFQILWGSTKKAYECNNKNCKQQRQKQTVKLTTERDMILNISLNKQQYVFHSIDTRCMKRHIGFVVWFAALLLPVLLWLGKPYLRTAKYLGAATCERAFPRDAR